MQKRMVKAIATLAALLVAALNVAVFPGGVYWPPLDMLASFAPALLVFAIAAVVFTWRAKAPRYAVVSAAIAASLPAAAIGIDLAGAINIPERQTASKLKVMTINVWSRNRTLEAVEKLIESERPNVLFIQEASSKNFRNFLQRIGTLYATHLSNDPVNCATHVFSSFSLVRQDNEWAYCDFVSAQLALPNELGGGSLRVASVHLSRSSSWQPAVVQTALSQSARASLIVGGDFNRTPWSWSLRNLDQIPGLDRRTHGLPTWPTPARFEDTWLTTPFPILPIDHIFASNDWRTSRVRLGPDVGSDHYPVIVEMQRQR